MNKHIAYCLVLVSLFLISGCATNTLTNRSSLSLVSDEQIMSSSVTQYQQFLSTNKVISPNSGNKDAAIVTKVSNRVITAIKKYYSDLGRTSELDGYSWEINTVVSNEANAWCMPGGKIVVYTGILPITQNEAALAVVIGHEVTHALAKHGKERMSQALLQQYGGQALNIALANKSKETQQLYGNAYGLGTQYGIMLPFSRKNEYEADKYGLVFTALAGYDPHEAISFWKRMAQSSGGQKPPEFASTHPSDENRIAQLQSIMDETVSKYYKPQH